MELTCFSTADWLSTRDLPIPALLRPFAISASTSSSRAVARVYNVGFDDDQTFQLIGTDGGLLERPHATRRVQISPGEGAEIVVRLAPGERPVLRSYAPELGLNRFESRVAGGDDSFDLLQVRAAPDLRPGRVPPDRLAEVAGPAETDAVTTRHVELDGSSRINGRKMDLARTDFEVVVGTADVWEVRNGADVIHNFHIHDVQFRVLAYGDRPPPPQLDGWKDTVFLPPGRTARLLVQFTDYADPTTPYMFHCHVLLHEDSGMMGQFVVVEPGQSAAVRAPRGHH